MAQPPESDVSSKFPFTLHSVDALDSKMAYVDTKSPSDSSAPTVIFLHGNPTSSYLYRNIIPHVSPKLRCVAPDLIGMGFSGKPDIAYRFADHVRYLDAFLDSVVPEGKVLLVIQDWGSALGFNWAYRHQDRVAGLAFMEFVAPFEKWDGAAEGETQKIFRSFRNPISGRKLIIEQNLFVEVLLPRGAVRPLTSEEKEYYGAPFKDEKSREPLYRFPNEIPIEGEPVDVYEIAQRYHNWLLETELPKLFFWATPGMIVTEEKAKWYLERLKNVKGVYVGQGLHFLQEDHPHQIGNEIVKWIDTIKL